MNLSSKDVWKPRGRAAFPPLLSFCSCVQGVAVARSGDLQFWGGLPSSAPAWCRLFGNAEEQQPPERARAAPTSPSLQRDLRCGPTTRIHAPEENLDFIVRCLQVTITQSQFGGPFVHIFCFASLTWMASQSSPGLQIVALFSWVCTGDSCWERWG